MCPVTFMAKLTGHRMLEKEKDWNTRDRKVWGRGLWMDLSG